MALETILWQFLKEVFMHFSHTLGRSIASAAIVCGALSGFAPSYAAAASFIPAPPLRNSTRSAALASQASADALLEKSQQTI